MEARLGRVMVERDAAIAERDAALNEVNAIRELLPYSSPLRGGASPPPEPKAAASPDPVVVLTPPRPQTPSPRPQTPSPPPPSPPPRPRLSQEEPSCAAAGWHCADAIAHSCGAVGSIALSCWTAARASMKLGDEAKSSVRLLSSLVLSCAACQLCKLPAPPPRTPTDDVEDDIDEAHDHAILEFGHVSAIVFTPPTRRHGEHVALVVILGAAAVVALIWNAINGGCALRRSSHVPQPLTHASSFLSRSKPLAHSARACARAHA